MATCNYKTTREATHFRSLSSLFTHLRAEPLVEPQQRAREGTARSQRGPTAQCFPSAAGRAS